MDVFTAVKQFEILAFLENMLDRQGSQTDVMTDIQIDGQQGDITWVLRVSFILLRYETLKRL